MKDLDKVISALDCLAHGGGTYDCLKFPCPYGFYGYTDCHKWEIAKDALELLKEQKQIVRCKDCKHRPELKLYSDRQGNYTAVEFPDGSKCPCQCEDFFYSWYPKDDWFCADGEMKDDG